MATHFLDPSPGTTADVFCRDHAPVLTVEPDDRRPASLRTLAALIGLVDKTRDALTDIDQRHRSNQNDVRMIMHGMLATVEQSFARLDLSDDQEDYLADVMQGAVQRVMNLFDQGLAIDDHLSTVAGMLGGAEETAFSGRPG